MDNIYETLIEKLNDATKAYDEGKPYMSDHEWDAMYWEVFKIEKKQGWASPNSPTQQVHYNVVNELVKVQHNHFMGSLDKTKSLDELNEFCGNRSVFLSLKLDGLTCSLHYSNGRLQRAETRGNGTVGEDITHNALVIPSIPRVIDYQGELVVDGEIICTDKDFAPFEEEYANSRNFAAGSIRLLDSQECARRNLTFVAWDVVQGFEEHDSMIFKLWDLALKNGFLIVPFEVIVRDDIITEHKVEELKNIASTMGYPIDGLVARYDDITYGRSLGATAHHRRDGLAFKFFDETVVSHLLDIEWTMGRTGVLTPVAIFEPVDFDGSTIERASLHNVSIMEELFGIMGPYKGDEVHVFKANMIIPQIQSVKHLNTNREYKIEYPQVCPVCGEEVCLNTMNSSTFIVCTNPACEGKLINKLDHFCGKSGLDIKGLSKATLEKLIDWGWVNCFADLFKLKEYEANWKLKPGFGEASVRKILNAIEEARTNSTHDSFISAIGIPMIGKTMVKELMKNGVTTYNQLRNMVDDKFDFSQFNGFGYEKSDSLLRFKYHEADEAYHEMTLVEPSVEEKKENTLEGKSIVITGTLNTFKNRAELQRVIEAAGGKVVGSVSKNTSYLINNDIESTSAKNQTAKRLGVPIITEEDFLKII